MAKSLYIAPKPFLFLSEGISYTISEVLRSVSGNAMPCNLTFNITYFIKNTPNGMPDTSSESFSVLLYPEMTYRSGNYYLKWNIDLTNVLEAYAQRLCIKGQYIKGYATVQLVEIDGESTDLDENPHICLYGTSGGIDIDPDSTEELPVNIHPFLLARGNEEGALHFYRSELKAMDVIFTLYPSPDIYTLIYFDTDERSWPDQDIEHSMFVIQDQKELLGLRYYEGDQSCQYDITGANAIFLHLIQGSYEIDSRMYTIAVQDDPDTDEIHLIRWTNSMGAPEALLFTGELVDKSEIEKADIYIHDQGIKTIQRGQQRGLVTTKYSLQTGYLTPGRIVALRDMLTSEEVEMLIDGEWIPVSIDCDTTHAVHQREPESFELTIEVLEQTRYHKPNRTVRPLPDTRAGLLMDIGGNIILDNNSNTVQENG